MENTTFTALYKAGTQLLHQGKPEEAIPLLEEAVRQEPLEVNAALNLGGAYILTKRFSKAVEVLEPISILAPDHAMIWTNLGAAYLGNPILAGDEQQRKAITAFETALEINSAAPNVAYNLGLIYRDRKENEKAIFWFEEAVKQNPNDRDARSLLHKLQGFDQEE